jgi:pimeloyl-ACP methyl ester carboxylesterase
LLTFSKGDKEREKNMTSATAKPAASPTGQAGRRMRRHAGRFVALILPLALIWAACGGAEEADAPAAAAPSAPDIHAALAALPRPRKHYQWYYSTRQANTDMWRCPQGVHAFLRAYYHHKSADWKANKPFPLAGWTAEELAKLPTYYIMDLQETMAETVAHEMPTPAEIAACGWLSEAELGVYAEEYQRNGFQGGLQWYRCRTTGRFTAEHEIFSGRTIDVPSCFIAGASDWGIHQIPGAIETMRRRACTAMRDVHLLEGAGHWVQQEQPQEVTRLLLQFLGATAGQ